MWVLEYNISVRALRALLNILDSTPLEVPKDPRTIKLTPRNVAITKMGENDAQYWHQGVETCLRAQLSNLSCDTAINLNVNVDGLPLFNSASKCFWPILINIAEYPRMPPMAIGIYYGVKKPENCSIYFRPFVEEMKMILRDGLIINGHKLSVEIRCFICDSPARAFVKGMHMHS